MSHPIEEDIASNALELLSTTSTWLLARHQWLTDNMRCVLTGESPPSLADLQTFDDMIPKYLKLPDNLMKSFIEIKSSLEKSWLDASKAVHPMSGLTIFEQLNNFQTSAHQFMQVSKRTNQELLHAFAMRDSLTGTRTRLTLKANLFEELKNSMRHKDACSIAIIDHDNFKSINERWGRNAGDQILVKIAEVIQKNLRHHDKLFRYGGDEWLIIMPDTTKEAANKILERLQKACHTHEFKSINNASFYAFFSYGVAESQDDLTPNDWLALAENHLCKNKPKQEATVHQYAAKSQPEASVG